MRVLIVTFRFPPSNIIGAVRVGKLARYLDRRGHDVRVLTTDIDDDRTLPVEIAPHKIIYTDYLDDEPVLSRLRRRLTRRSSNSPHSTALPTVIEAATTLSLKERLRTHYYGLIHIPDLRKSWLKTAVPAGRKLFESWRPDVIFASAPPYTGLLVAERLSRISGVPWVADMRDLWTDNAYYGFPTWRWQLDRCLEKRTFRNVSAFVTTSPSFAKQLRKVHGKRSEVVLNGYAEEDFPPLPPEGDPAGPLTIRYLGGIYRGRDPSPLFAAVAMLEPAERRQVRIDFFGESGEEVAALAAKHGAAEQTVVHAKVPYRTALELQLSADVLLLLNWNDARDEGSIPAKLFEYFYARRRILFIGYEKSNAAGLIMERNAGAVSGDSDRIRDLLRGWLADKRAGRLARLDPSVSRGLSRDEQFRELERVLGEIADSASPPRPC